MKRIIYLDNSATTRLRDDVADYMDDIARNAWGNPSSLHSMGLEAEKLVKAARESIASSIKADPGEIIFTSGGTEANNLAIMGWLEANPRAGRHIITTAIEHPSVLEVFSHLERKGFKVDRLSVGRDGSIDLDAFERLVTNETSFVSVMLVNNETGGIQPCEAMAGILKKRSKAAAFHADAVQACGKIPVFPAKAGIDLMSVSSHKIHGPKGSGCLYASRNIRLAQMLLGGGQESARRSGTENVPGICGFGLAAKKASETLNDSYSKVSALNRMLKNALVKDFDHVGILSPAISSPYILNASFGGIKAEVLLHSLEAKGIFVSTGSACSSRRKKRSHVLKAMGFSSAEAEGALRFSFSAMNESEDVELLLEALHETVPALRKSGGAK